MDPSVYGQKLKQIYAGGVAKDGRKYTDIPDAELGAKYIQAQGLDKASASLGIDLQAIQDKRKQANTQATADAEGDKAFQLAKGSIQNLLDTYNKLPELQKTQGFASLFNRVNSQGADYAAQALGLAPALKSIEGAGKGSGVRVTQAELTAWSKLLPSTTKNDATNKQDLVSLNKQLVNSFGQGLDPQYLQRYGISPDTGESQSPIKSNLMGLLKGAVVDPVKGVANYGRDVGAGLGQIVTQGHQNQQVQQGNDLLAQIKAETDPAKRQALIEQASQQFSKGSDTSSRLAAMFSPDVNKNPLQRGFETAATVMAPQIAEVGGGLIGKAASPLLGLLSKGGETAATDAAGQIAQNPSIVKTILSNLTKKQLGRTLEGQIGNATKQGANVTAKDLLTSANAEAGPQKDVQALITKKLAPYLKGNVKKETLDPSTLAQIRQDAAKRLPSNFFTKNLVQGLASQDRLNNIQADEALRRAATGHLKDIANTGQLDKLYNVYSKFGSPAEIAAKSALAEGLNVAPIPKSLKTTLQTGEGGQALLKLLGLF